MAWKNYNKYKNEKIEVDGISFDSKREAERYKELLLLERAGQISNLQRQVKYVLIPAQYKTTDVMIKKGKHAGQYKTKLVERECAYISDFSYTDMENGQTVVEDTKGFKTKDYVIKRKLMLHVHGIEIREI